MEKQEKYTPVKNICFLLKELWNADKLLVIYTLFKALSENIYYVFSYVWLTKYIYRCIELGTPFNEFTKVIVIICVIHIMIHISSAGHQYHLKTRTPIVYKHIYGKVIDTELTREFSNEGTMLSGGEAQKVAISRMFLKGEERKIAILDEPSSALDPIAEYTLNQNMMENAKDSTIIFISHRLSTTRDADKIYMFAKGRIVEQGTHDELMAMQGEYAKMFIKQAEKYVIS